MKEYYAFLVDDDLSIYNKYTKNKLTPYLGSDGYYQVVAKHDGKIYRKRIHVIYANCFIPNPNEYKYVNHINSDKTDNRLENLEWCTNSYNVKHGWHSGNRIHKNRTHIQIRDTNTGNIIGTYNSIRQCAKELKLDRHKIARVLKKELRDDYLGVLIEYI